MNERIAAESSKSDHSIDDEMRIIQQENAINPVIVEGKRVFGFDIGDVLRIEYICDEPPLGCAWAAWMKEQAYKNKFIAHIVKLVSPTKSLTRRTIFKIHNKFVKFQSEFSNCCMYRYSKSKPKSKPLQLSLINLRNLETVCELVERLHVNLSRHFV